MNHTETERITTKQTVQELLSAAMPRPKVIKSGWPRIIGMLALVGLFRWLAGRQFPPRVRGFFGKLSKLGVFAAAVTAYSYRDPHREPLGNASDFVYAPADGTILRVEPVEDEPLFIKGPAYRILITSQPLDVPVLRAPLPGQVEYILQKTDDGTSVGVKGSENRRSISGRTHTSGSVYPGHWPRVRQSSFLARRARLSRW